MTKRVLYQSMVLYKMPNSSILQIWFIKKTRKRRKGRGGVFLLFSFFFSYFLSFFLDDYIYKLHEKNWGSSTCVKKATLNFTNIGWFQGGGEPPYFFFWKWGLLTKKVTWWGRYFFALVDSDFAFWDEELERKGGSENTRQLENNTSWNVENWKWKKVVLKKREAGTYIYVIINGFPFFLERKGKKSKGSKKNIN